MEQLKTKRKELQRQCRYKAGIQSMRECVATFLAQEDIITQEDRIEADI